MPENPLPATQPEAEAEPGELNFAKPPTENPRIKRRSLKTKTGVSLKPASALPPGARELEKEVPPLSVEQTQKSAQKPTTEAKAPAATAAPKAAESPVAPSRVIPAAPAKTSSPAPSAAAPKGVATPSNRPLSSPHGTRPATLYYSSYPRKDKEASSPMKSTPTASPASSSSAAAMPSSAARSAATPRAAAPVDYRANVERQSREQKSVGNILAYVVYALIALFVLGAALAGYGTYVLSRQIHDQSVTVNDLDQRYAAATNDLKANLAITKQNLKEAQAKIDREQELIVQQQDALNRLSTDSADTINALKLERQSRTQETAVLRARIRDVEYRAANTSTTQKL